MNLRVGARDKSERVSTFKRLVLACLVRYRCRDRRKWTRVGALLTASTACPVPHARISGWTGGRRASSACRQRRPYANLSHTHIDNLFFICAPKWPNLPTEGDFFWTLPRPHAVKDFVRKKTLRTSLD